MAKAKAISLLLNDGTLKGVISMEDSSWNKGELYSAPRESVDDLILTDTCSRFGVYLLLSEDMVYIGQASDLAKRIKQHIVGKSWWERVVVLTTSDNSLTRADLDYIESTLIAKASSVGKLDCDNKNTGNKENLSRFRRVEMEQYLEEALFLLELIGITVFCDSSKKKKTDGELISSVVNSTEGERAIREKKEAIKYLKDKGFSIINNVNYASRQEKKEEFWINPNIRVLKEDWQLILNNQYENELVLLRIPAESFIMRTEASKEGLISRHDQPNKIDLTIEANSFVDRRSKKHFSQYIIHRIKY